ncbi:MAG TPA: hypothetical protein VKA12_01700, partial [Roseiarcus sp.]|nr:hypothetical protein [Roseiarcus sp.]
ALARKAGLKSHVAPAFSAALAAIKTHGGADGEGLNLSLVQRVIDECERRDDPALGKVLALLWRFAAEAARAEAAGFTREAIAAAPARPLPHNLDFSPVNDDAGRALTLTGNFARLSPAQLEFSATTEDPGEEDLAPRIELPIDLIAALDDAA